MEKTRQLIQAKNLLTLLASIFLVSEAFFLNVVLQDGNGDVAGAFAKTLFFYCLFISCTKGTTGANGRFPYYLCCIPFFA
ncbi:hypothetical protein D770_24810 [Flammeovirgaceae bacterium 311]|nr:hypothetical protein D770_24810 [Flammeovirgaceae bacterium 311]